MNNLLAQAQAPGSNSSGLFGAIKPPPGVVLYSGGQTLGIPIFFSNIIKTLIVGAGIYAFLNFIFAGYAFLSASDDPKKIEGAWAKIYQSIIGLAVTAGSFVLAAVVGLLLFKDADALLQLKVFGVN